MGKLGVPTFCRRCQRRADWAEKGRGFRSECQDLACEVYSCYGRVPQIPIVQAANIGERRPVLAPATVAGRSHAVRELLPEEVRLRVSKVKEGFVLWWEVKAGEGRRHGKSRKKTAARAPIRRVLDRRSRSRG